MKIRTYFLSILLLLLVMTSACGDSWFKVKIISPLPEYNTASSTVPGIPLKVSFDVDGSMPSISSITFITNTGRFIELDGDMIINLGQSTTLSGNQIFWSPLEENGEMASGARITAVVSYIDRFVEVAKSSSSRITKDKDGTYTLK